MYYMYKCYAMTRGNEQPVSSQDQPDDFSNTPRVKIPLDAGTLLIMEGAIQDDWQVSAEPRVDYIGWGELTTPHPSHPLQFLSICSAVFPCLVTSVMSRSLESHCLLS